MKKLLLVLALLAPLSAAAQTLVPTGGSSTPCTTTALSLQYNSAGAFGCISGWTTNGTTTLTGGASTTVAIGGATIGTDALAWAGTATGSGRLTVGGITNTVNGAASAASNLFNGTLFTGGSGTTTFPQIFVQPTGTTAVTAWSTSGTILGMNVVSGFAGNFLDFHASGAASVFSITSAGTGNFAGVVNASSGSGTSVFSNNLQVNNALSVFGNISASGTATVGTLAADATSTIGWTGRATLSSASTTAINTSASLIFGAAAQGITLKQGANGRVGTFVANGATPVTVSNTSVAITDTIIISLNTVGGTGPVIQPFVATITAATGFTTAANTGDTSTYNYAIIKNAP